MRSFLILSVLGLALQASAGQVPGHAPGLVFRRHLWECTDVKAGPDYGYLVQVLQAMPSQRVFVNVSSQTKAGPVLVRESRVVTVGPAIGRGFTVFTDQETLGKKLTLTINGNQKGGFTAKDAKGRTHKAQLNCRRGQN